MRNQIGWNEVNEVSKYIPTSWTTTWKYKERNRCDKESIITIGINSTGQKPTTDYKFVAHSLIMLIEVFQLDRRYQGYRRHRPFHMKIGKIRKIGHMDQLEQLGVASYRCLRFCIHSLQLFTRSHAGWLAITRLMTRNWSDDPNHPPCIWVPAMYDHWRTNIGDRQISRGSANLRNLWIWNGL